MSKANLVQQEWCINFMNQNNFLGFLTCADYKDIPSMIEELSKKNVHIINIFNKTPFLERKEEV